MAAVSIIIGRAVGFWKSTLCRFKYSIIQLHRVLFATSDDRRRVMLYVTSWRINNLSPFIFDSQSPWNWIRKLLSDLRELDTAR
jgi:hypothetical protein